MQQCRCATPCSPTCRAPACTALQRLLAIDGAELLFGGEELNGGQHTIPKKYGALQPTAVFVPLRKMLQVSRRACMTLSLPCGCRCAHLRLPVGNPMALQDKHYETVTTEVFGPLQVRGCGDADVIVPLVASLVRWRPGCAATRACARRLQVVTEYSNKSVDKVIEACDRMHAHLTAAIVSKDEQFR